MKYLLYIVIFTLILSSCSDNSVDDNKPTIPQELKGKWEGFAYGLKDTARLSLDFGEQYGDNFCRAEFQLIYYVISGSSEFRYSIDRNGTSNYIYSKPNLNVTLLSDNEFNFNGNISITNNKLLGKVNYINLQNEKVSYNIELIKAN